MKINQKNLTDKLVATCIDFSDGSAFEFLNAGASLTKWMATDQTDIVAGYQNVRDYLEGGMYLGTTVGLTAGRIAKGRCRIDGKEYRFNATGKNFLHGGIHGLSFSLFELESLAPNGEEAIVTYKIDHADDVLPGTVTIRIRYTAKPGTLRLDFFATATEATLCNLTNHSYFNLDGDFTHDLSSHRLRVRASQAVLVDGGIIGTAIQDVPNTLFDFRQAKPLMPVVTDPRLKSQAAFGIDHLFLLDRMLPGPDLTLISDKTKKQLEINTSYPGITLYSSNYPGKKLLHDGTALGMHSALAIEPQFPSNGINDPRFPDTILRPGRVYHHFIEYTLKNS